MSAGPQDRDRTDGAEDSGRNEEEGLRVLVVDDVEDAAESLAMMLRLWGHEVETAYDGNSALERARTFVPEVILLDLGLPNKDGHEVARELRGMDVVRDATIIAITGYDREDDRRRVRESGFQRHLTKPVDSGELRNTLARLRRA